MHTVIMYRKVRNVIEELVTTLRLIHVVTCNCQILTESQSKGLLEIWIVDSGSRIPEQKMEK